MSDRDHQSLAVRPASTEDESTLFHWRNLPWVIELGASRGSVAHDQHHAWFAETLERQSRCLFIVDIDNQPAGMVRYDLVSKVSVEISIFLMPEFVGKGLGTQVFFRSIPLLLSWHRVDQIIARVLTTNQTSLRFFTRLGFVVDDQRSTADCIVLNRGLQDIPHSRPFLGQPKQKRQHK
ncbi:MAG: GNAT family N-acetyltransferase [Chloroflexi bacterium]|nr:GNAT family N-acetyltransferase [Chloroflexota bacterium]